LSAHLIHGLRTLQWSNLPPHRPLRPGHPGLLVSKLFYFYYSTCTVSDRLTLKYFDKHMRVFIEIYRSSAKSGSSRKKNDALKAHA